MKSNQIEKGSDLEVLKIKEKETRDKTDTENKEEVLQEMP